MDNLDESENNAKISDSAYSNSCSNSQSRRSHSSTHSGSLSSRSSGYGGKQSNSSSNQDQTTENRKKDKDLKKKKQVKSDLVQVQADVEFRLPKPALACGVKEQVSNVLPESPILAQVENRVESDKKVDIKSGDNMVTSSAPQTPVKIVMSKPSSTNGFSCVISMHDGVVVYTSTSLTDALGFPKELWLGRSFIDFIHPSDHNTFASQITSGVATPNKMNLNSATSNESSVSTMFCRIRRYRGLTASFGVTERAVTFMPFMLKLSFRNISNEQGVIIYLVIQATPVFSAFKTTHEIVEKAVPFVMRHVSNGNLEYIDHESVPLLGYLPQDVNGKDVLRLYHPDDLVYMTQIYETIVSEGGAPRSKPYRFLAQNGHYLKLETEWSSFINPWSRKLEFVTGKHHVIEGPENPDVFHPPVADKSTSEEKNKAQDLREGIARIMNEVLTKPSELAKQQMSKRCQDLASFMETLMEDPPKVRKELRVDVAEFENSFYERDSVMLGGISPHHDNDSKSSSTTPMSYNQLNFNENLQRFFGSHLEISYDDYQDVRGRLTPKGTLTLSGGCMSPMAQQSGDSAELTSSGESTGAAAIDTGNKLPRLTESLLIKHNSQMEKSLVLHHRECRKENKEKTTIDKKNKKDHLARCNIPYLNTPEASIVVEPQAHGLKRASKPPEAEAGSNKHHCAAPQSPHRGMNPPAAPAQSVPNVTSAESPWQQGAASAINLYMPNLGVPQQSSGMSAMTAVPGLMSMYCVPTTGPTLSTSSEMITDFATSDLYTMSHLPYMLYGQSVFASSLAMSPVNNHVSYPTQQRNPTSSYSSNQDNYGCKTSNIEETNKDAQKTSDSSDVKMKPPQTVNSKETVYRTDEESSFSSFCSSFFKTESGSGTDSADDKKGPIHGANLRVKESKNDSAPDKVTTRKRQPPWMEQVCVTSELVYKYQMLTKDLTDVLEEDQQKMKSLVQPCLVNDQLGQLYRDLELEGVAARLNLEEEVTSSGSSGEDTVSMPYHSMSKRLKRKLKYGKLVMIYEEDAPIPSPYEAESESEAPQPENTQPEAPHPESSQPESSQPEAPQPEAPQPEAPQPEAPQPEAPQPEAPQTEAPQKEAPQPEAPQPEAPQPEAHQPEAPQPEAPQPKAPQPEAPQSEAPQPEAPQSEAPQPEAPQPEAPQPEASQPEGLQPEAPQPEAHQPEAPLA